MKMTMIQVITLLMLKRLHVDPLTVTLGGMKFQKTVVSLCALKSSGCALSLYRYFWSHGPQICATPHCNPYPMENCYVRLLVKACELYPEVYLGLKSLLLCSLSA